MPYAERLPCLPALPSVYIWPATKRKSSQIPCSAIAGSSVDSARPQLTSANSA